MSHFIKAIAMASIMASVSGTVLGAEPALAIPAGTEVQATVQSRSGKTATLLINIPDNKAEYNAYDSAAKLIDGCTLTLSINDEATTKSGAKSNRVTINGEQISCNGKKASIAGFVPAGFGVAEVKQGIKGSIASFVFTKGFAKP